MGVEISKPVPRLSDVHEDMTLSISTSIHGEGSHRLLLDLFLFVVMATPSS